MKLNISILVVLTIIVAGCGSTPATPPSIAAEAQAVATVELATATPSFQALEPVPDSELAPPVLIEIPEIGLLHAVESMQWQIVETGGERTTVWVVPEDTAGWHVNSANAGADGNVIISGHQEQGEAVFKAIALGSVRLGQEVNLTSESGRVFVYKVIEISQPVPLEDTSAEQLALVGRYYAQSDVPLLTLITGWPDFTTTHRIFVQAELVGQRN